MDHPAQPLTLDQALARYRDTFLASRNLAPRTRTEYLTDLTDVEPGTFGQADRVILGRHHSAISREIAEWWRGGIPCG